MKRQHNKVMHEEADQATQCARKAMQRVRKGQGVMQGDDVTGLM
jgi:hypothetical protein